MLAISGESPPFFQTAPNYNKLTLFLPEILKKPDLNDDGPWFIVRRRRKKTLAATANPENFKQNYEEGFKNVYLADLLSQKNRIVRKLVESITKIQTDLNYDTIVVLLYFLYQGLEIEIKLSDKTYPFHPNDDVMKLWLNLPDSRNAPHPRYAGIISLLNVLMEIYDLIDFVNGNDASPTLERTEHLFQSYCDDFDLPRQPMEAFLDRNAEFLIAKLNLRLAIDDFHHHQSQLTWEVNEWSKFQIMLADEGDDASARLEFEFELGDFASSKVEAFIKEGTITQQQVKQRNWDGFINLYFRRCLSVCKYRELIALFPSFLSKTQDVSLATLLFSVRANNAGLKEHLNSIALYILFINKSTDLDLTVPHSILTRVSSSRTFGFFKRVIENELMLQGKIVSKVNIKNDTNEWWVFKKILSQDHKKVIARLMREFSPQHFEKAAVETFIKEGSPEQQEVKQRNWYGFVAAYFKKCLGLGRHQEFIRLFPNFLSSTRDTDLAKLLLTASPTNRGIRDHLNSLAIYIFYINNDARARLSLPCNLSTRVRPDRAFGYYQSRIELERRQLQAQPMQGGI